jgi:hypothetical protein
MSAFSLRRWITVVLVGVLASFVLTGLVGCSKKEVDPYVYDSLRRVMYGDSLSFDFLYEVDAPQFDYVKGNTGMVRDGNMLWFMVGHDLENQYRSYAGALLGVQKFFTPQPYLMIKRVKKAGISQPVDSVKSFIMPRLIPASAVDLETPGADLPGLKWNRKSDFVTFVPEDSEDEIAIQSMIERFVRVARHDLPDSVKANPSAEHMAWYAIFEESTLEIEDLTPGAEWVLEMLLEKDLPLVGSFTVKEFYDSILVRRVEHEELGHVIGKMKINWFRFANAFVQGSAS